MKTAVCVETGKPSKLYAAQSLNHTLSSSHENLRGRHLLSFMEPEVSLSCSKESTTGPCPESDESSPYCHTYLYKGIKISSSYRCYLSFLDPSGSYTDMLYSSFIAPICRPATHLARLFFLDLITFLCDYIHPPVTRFLCKIQIVMSNQR
jgi:hypothetical protein